MRAEQPEWGAPQPPPAPKKKHRIRNIVLALVGVVALIVVASVAAGGGGTETSKPPAGSAQEQSDTQKEADEAQKKMDKAIEDAQKQADEFTTEKKDLVSFKFDDRSQYGLTDIWVTWTITNNSSKVSDYMWDWEAVDSSGVRVDNSTEYVYNVKPGQTVTGESPAMAEDPNLKLNVTEFDRTESY